MNTSIISTTLVGWQSLKGTSEKSGKPKDYSIQRINCLFPLVGTGVAGYSSQEFSCSELVMEKVKTNLEFPCPIELEVANVVVFGKLQQQVLGVSFMNQSKPVTTK